MKDYSDSTVGGGALIGVAALLLLVAALSGRGDMTSATLILVGVGSFIGGIFLLIQYGGESAAPWIAGIVAAAPVVDLARLCADLGLQGDAHVLMQDGQLVQVVPVGDRTPAMPPDDYSFIDEKHGGGVQLLPTGRLLYDRLVTEYDLVVPTGVEGLCTAIREVGEDVLELAEKVEAGAEGDVIVVRLAGYRLFEGCLAIRAASPKCCTMIGCPICNLFACMTVVSLGQACVIEHVSTDEQARSVRLMLRPLA